MKKKNDSEADESCAEMKSVFERFRKSSLKKNIA
jgi:hypothetical protein